MCGSSSTCAPSRTRAPIRNITATRCRAHCQDSRLATSISRSWAAVADDSRTCRRPRMRSGGTKVSTITPTMRWARIFTRRSGDCDNSHSERCAIMCAETLWWQCHRRIISDYLIAAGEAVFHILGPDHVARAFMTPAAKLGADEVLTYRVQV